LRLVDGIELGRSKRSQGGRSSASSTAKRSRASARTAGSASRPAARLAATLARRQRLNGLLVSLPADGPGGRRKNLKAVCETAHYQHLALACILNLK
jgi:hypothetical protein